MKAATPSTIRIAEITNIIKKDMDPLTLITAAMTMLSPYLTKAGEKISEEMGTSLWSWLKSKFSKGHNMPEVATVDDTNKIQMALMQLISSSPTFAQELETKMKEIKSSTSSSGGQMNVINQGTVENQVNASVITGNITL